MNPKAKKVLGALLVALGAALLIRRHYSAVVHDKDNFYGFIFMLFGGSLVLRARGAPASRSVRILLALGATAIGWLIISYWR